MISEKTNNMLKVVEMKTLRVIACKAIRDKICNEDMRQKCEF